MHIAGALFKALLAVCAVFLIVLSFVLIYYLLVWLVGVEGAAFIILMLQFIAFACLGPLGIFS